MSTGPNPRFDVGDARRNGVGIGHVERRHARGDALRRQRFRGFGELVQVAAVEHDLRARAPQAPRDARGSSPEPPPVTSAREPVRSNGWAVVMRYPLCELRLDANRDAD